MSLCASWFTAWPRPGFTRMPVVDRGEERKLVGMISLEDLLHARTRNLTEEQSRLRILRIASVDHSSTK